METQITSRPLGEVEMFFAALSAIGTPIDREHATLFIVLHLRFPPSIPDPEPYLARAWEIVGHRYPALGSTLSGPDPSDSQGRPTLVVPQYEGGDWLDKTFSSHPDCGSVDDLLADMGRPSTLRCCWLPKLSQLMIRTSHWRIDGIGLALLANVLSETVANVIRGGLSAPLPQDAFSSIPPSLESLARSKIDIHSNAGPDKLRMAIDEVVTSFAHGLPGIGLPTRQASESHLPGPSARAAVTLDKETTSRVASASRSLGFSVTCAVHAAIIRVVSSFEQKSHARKYTSFGPLNLRDNLSMKDIPGGSQPHGVLQSGLPISLDAFTTERTSTPNDRRDFKSIAHELRESYAADLESFHQLEGGGHASFLEGAQSYISRLLQMLKDAPQPDAAQITTPDLSSLGKLEKFMQHEYSVTENPEEPQLELSNYWMGIEVLTRILVFHLWSWKGELVLSVSWNRSYYEREFVTSILDSVVKEMLDELNPPETARNVWNLVPAEKMPWGGDTCTNT
ncbi:unnamed protein product [Clonostachys rosea]|uniref:Condensation domain-containing protein n=1 Tax=Bionectria ochroleuca TaxID=29856 RepID=A0ABY6V4G1_BIOOC|nr:unnamed protein product [Clonostachys rosea]